MKTYDDVEDFIIDVFPLEYQKIIKQKKSDIEKYMEKADADFEEKLEKIIKGEAETEPKETPEAEGAQETENHSVDW